MEHNRTRLHSRLDNSLDEVCLAMTGLCKVVDKAIGLGLDPTPRPILSSPSISDSLHYTSPSL